MIEAKVLTHNKYRPDIDGLRAVAVVSVVGFHAFPKVFAGGFIGVDIFFVISGYLISSIIFSNLERGSFSLVEFYDRRIRRIFPSLVTVMALSMVFGWYVLFASEFQQLGKHIIGGATYISNFILWRESGYFDVASESKPMLHLWSLAIEEQFYLFWPILMWIGWKLRWSIKTSIILLWLTSFAVNVIYTYTNPTAAFYSPISRFWELLVGAYLAYHSLHNKTSSHNESNYKSIAGAVLLISGFALIDESTPFPSFWALLPTFGTFLLISASNKAWINQRILGSKGFVWIGLISYPLYLWHWPILSFLRIIKPEPTSKDRILAVCITFILAWITYKLIESPVRYSKRRIAPIVGLVSVMCILLIIGLVSHQKMLKPRNDNPDLQPVISAVGDWEYPAGLSKKRNSPDGVYEVSSQRSDITLFIGDSHIDQYAPKVVEFVNNNSKISNSVVFVTSGGCPPIPGVQEDAETHKSCNETREYGISLINQEQVKSVVMGACWNCYFANKPNHVRKPGDYDYYVLDQGRKVFIRDSKGVEIAIRRLESFVASIKDKKTVYLLLDNPSGIEFDPKSQFVGGRLSSIHLKASVDSIRQDTIQLRIRDLLLDLAKRQKIAVFNPGSLLCSDGICSAVEPDGKPRYMDHNHLRPFFVRNYANFLDSTMLSGSK